MTFAAGDGSVARMSGKSIAFFFYAGDFGDVVRRHLNGEQQDYATHSEVAGLICDFADLGVEVTIYSYVTSEARTEKPLPGVSIVSLGARSYAEHGLLRRAVALDRSEALVPHFPNRAMLDAARRTGKRLFPFLASSFYRRHPRNWYERYRLASLLNDPAFELVANHCRPSTEHLAQIGVRRDKLIAWDVPHSFNPAMTESKTLGPSRELFYVGAINAAKGVAELLRAVALTDARCALAGTGDIQAMAALADSLGISERVRFLGRVGNEDVFRLMREADAIVIPSRVEFQEGLPLVMFEAVASHTPVICSDHPIFTHFMSDRENALVFNSPDARDLARAVTTLFSDAELYASLSRAAPSTWQKLGGTADWRTLVRTWFLKGPEAPWIRERMLGPT